MRLSYAAWALASTFSRDNLRAGVQLGAGYMESLKAIHWGGAPKTKWPGGQVGGCPGLRACPRRAR